MSRCSRSAKQATKPGSENMQRKRFLTLIAYQMLSIASIASLSMAAAYADDDEGAFLPRLVVSSTIPASGDLNPYGVAFVPQGFPAGGSITSTLAGLDTALGILQGGFILVGNVPTTDGTFGTISQGSLQIINRHGKLIKVLNDSVFLDTPWDLTINDNGYQAQVFVSNVKSGTVSRLDLAVGSSDVSVLRETRIAMGYTVQPNAAAVILGPTGLAYDRTTDILYVASTADNKIFAVPNAGKAVSPVIRGTPISASRHLRGPLGLVFAPDGNLLTANGDAVNADATHPSEIVEFSKSGEFVREFNVDASQGGAFGIATVLSGNPPFNFAAVDDVPNVISVYSLP